MVFKRPPVSESTTSREMLRAIAALFLVAGAVAASDRKAERIRTNRVFEEEVEKEVSALFWTGISRQV